MRQGQSQRALLPTVLASRLLTRVFRDRLRAGLFTGLIAAAATAGVLVAFGMGQRHPFLAFNIAAHVVFGAPATGSPVASPHALLTPVGIFIHLVAVIFWSTLFTFIAGHRRAAMVWSGAVVTAIVLFALNTRVLPSSFRPGYEIILTNGQLFFLYLMLAVSLVVGTRLANSARE
jgi:hypothetical protein